MSRTVMIVVLLAVGYIAGVKFPQLAQAVGLA